MTTTTAPTVCPLMGRAFIHSAPIDEGGTIQGTYPAPASFYCSSGGAQIPVSAVAERAGIGAKWRAALTGDVRAKLQLSYAIRALPCLRTRLVLWGETENDSHIIEAVLADGGALDPFVEFPEGSVFGAGETPGARSKEWTWDCSLDGVSRYNRRLTHVPTGRCWDWSFEA